jgi:phage/plasmid-associated DNA primase
VNRAKFIFSCNKLPDTDDDSVAYYRRFRIVHFPNTFDGEKDDKHLIEKLTTPTELSGLLNKSLEALDALLTRGRFAGDNLTMAEKRTDYKRRANSVYAFVSDRLEQAKGAEIEKKVLYGIYITYCHDTLQADPLIDVQFWKGLRHELGDAYDDGRPRGGDGRERVLKGWAVKGLVRVNPDRQISLGPMEENA